MLTLRFWIRTVKILKSLQGKITFVLVIKFIKNSDLIRPNAGNGFWLSVLIPMAYMINTWKHTTSAHFEYKLSTIISFGLFLQSIEIFLKLANNRINNLLNISTKLLPGGLCSFLVWICLKQGRLNLSKI